MAGWLPDVENPWRYWEIYNQPQLWLPSYYTPHLYSKLLTLFNFVTQDKASCVWKRAPAGLVDFKQYCNNRAVPVCYQLARDLFCWRIDSDSAALNVLQRANPEQTLHKIREEK